MRLYYMTELETAEKYIIPERRMKLSTFDKVNDPFELLCADQGEALQKRVLKVLRAHWSKRLGFICFSSNWRSPLMWAHYAKGHTGVCLGIEVTEPDKIRKMVYEPERMQGLFDASKPNVGASADTLLKVLTTKYKQWEYEDEYRVFAGLDEKDETTGLYYVDFGPTFMLREIIVGTRCKKPVGELAKLVRASGKVLEPVIVLKARPAFRTFSIVCQKLVKPITVSPTRR